MRNLKTVRYLLLRGQLHLAMNKVYRGGRTRLKTCPFHVQIPPVITKMLGVFYCLKAEKKSPDSINNKRITIIPSYLQCARSIITKIIPESYATYE